MDKYSCDLLVLGSGPAGCTAAIYAARAAINTILVHGGQPGGQLTTTTDVENYPGFASAVQGPQLMEQMIEQARNLKVQIIDDHIGTIKIGSNEEFICQGSSKYTSRSLIAATGAQAKWLGLDTEHKYKGYGISGCATCDGFFFKNKKVLVIGGGNTATEEALYLTKHAREVILIHRRDKLRAEKILQQKLFSNPKIKIIWNHKLIEVIGKENPLQVTGAALECTQTGKIMKLESDGIFVAIGHKPNTEIFSNIADMDKDGYIITAADSTQTSQKGFFAAGDVQDKVYRQAVTAAGTGCMAALEAAKYLEENS
jgi:thioredoxin reductase (NADPH)